MAVIEQLNKSISAMSNEELFPLVRDSRARRRLRPTAAQRKKKAPAKTQRAPKKRMAKQDAFAMVQGMSEKEKLALAKKMGLL